MAKTLTQEGMREVFAQNSGSVMVPIVEFSHSSLADPIRIVSDAQSLTFGGNTYTPLPFQIALPEDSEDGVPTVELTVDNVGRTLVEILRSVLDPVSVELSVIRIDQQGLATREIGPLTYSVLGANITPQTIKITLGYLLDILNEPATKEIFNPGIAPALFK